MGKLHRYSLFAFYGLVFVTSGITSFTPKYFGEIGMSDAQIGILTSVPAIVGIFFQTTWGVISDRVKYKRNILIFSTLIGGALYFLTGLASGFWLILIGMTAINLMILPVTPVSAAISLEYTKHNGKSFGPIRMSGTIGYQVGALAIGFILTSSLKGVFQIIGILMMLCAGVAAFLPPVEGHQHSGEKVSFFILFKNKKLLMLLLISFIACTSSAFYMSFFTKHLGDIGIDNGATGVITVISLILEIPFLVFSQRLYKKLSIWHWLLIGLILNGIRWIGLGFATEIGWVIAANIPAVSIMACFEFFPALYINDHTPDALKGSAQSLLSLTTFGVTKITGSLLGGFLSNAIGIPAVFIILGVILLVFAVIFIIPCRRMTRADRIEEEI